jgi:predicted membrane channel-forming protein YqfA (hemolysin III family)
MEKTFFSLSEKVIELINMSISVIISLAVVGFIWGIVKFMFNAGNEKARTEARAFMLYGVLTLFVMTSLWGFVNLLSDTLGLENGYVGDVNNRQNDPTPDPFDNVDDAFKNNNDQRMI